MEFTRIWPSRKRKNPDPTLKKQPNQTGSVYKSATLPIGIRIRIKTLEIFYLKLSIFDILSSRAVGLAAPSVHMQANIVSPI